MEVPKKFITAIRVPYGPMAGRLADPCICGYHTSLEDLEGDETIWLITHKGRLMFCHEECIPTPEIPDA